MFYPHIVREDRLLARWEFLVIQESRIYKLKERKLHCKEDALLLEAAILVKINMPVQSFINFNLPDYNWWHLYR